MQVLCIDTATTSSSVALLDENRTYYEILANSGMKHSRTLLGMIHQVLQDTGSQWDQVDAIAVTRGPGSFTGLRIGMATAKGLALALKKDIIGIPTLDALAYNAARMPYLICPILNARKGEVYAAFYRGGKDDWLKISPDLAMTPGELTVAAREFMGECGLNRVVFLGDGVNEYGSWLRSSLGEAYVAVGEPLGFIRASAVGRLAVPKLLSGEKDDVFTITPAYVRLSEAEARLARK